MYIGDKLVDQVVLSQTAMHNVEEREAYIQGAINDLLEKWEHLIQGDGQQPRFTIRTGAWHSEPGT
jgi:hypothetical protein